MRSLLGVFAATTLAVGAAQPLVAQENSITDMSLTSLEARAEGGDTVAKATLGWIYESGHGVEADTEKAAQQYRAASLQGDGFAKWRLGVMMDHGLTAGSAVEAVDLFREAAAAKIAGAASSLGVMYASGRGVERDFDAAMRYYQAAARMGSAHGLQGIGVLYANGQGVDRNMEEALAYWLVAAAGGDEDAIALLIDHMPPSSSPEAAPVYARANQIADAYDKIIGPEARSASLLP